MKKKRLEFVRAHVNWTESDWSKVSFLIHVKNFYTMWLLIITTLIQVCFSDESCFECHDGTARRAWHKKKTDAPVAPKVKHPTKVGPLFHRKDAGDCM